MSEPASPALGRRVVDILVVSSNTTPGLRRDFDELLDALHRSGLTFVTATSNFGVLDRARRVAQPVDDLIVTAGLRHSVRRALRRFEPRSVIVTSSLAGALLSRSLLGRSAIRMDGVVTATRRRALDAPSRLMERRCLRAAHVLLPYSTRVQAAASAIVDEATPVVVWPSPVRPGPPPASDRTPAALIYAGNPHKKGLDLAVEAWRLAAGESHRLFITGISEEVGRRFLAARGVIPPRSVEWLGQLSQSDYRRLSATVTLYLGASRVDEFATTQLEALLDGALLVTAPSEGPIEALQLAQELDRRLVARDVSAEGLAAAITVALALEPGEQDDYRRRARKLMTRYTRESFDARLRGEVLPLLGLGSASAERPG